MSKIVKIIVFDWTPLSGLKIRRLCHRQKGNTHHPEKDVLSRGLNCICWSSSVSGSLVYPCIVLITSHFCVSGSLVYPCIAHTTSQICVSGSPVYPSIATTTRFIMTWNGSKWSCKTAQIFTSGYYYITLLHYIIFCEFFTSLANGFSLSDNKSPQVLNTLLTIQADLNNTVICMVSICPLISNSYRRFSTLLGTVSRSSITTGITVK